MTLTNMNSVLMSFYSSSEKAFLTVFYFLLKTKNDEKLKIEKEQFIHSSRFKIQVTKQQIVTATTVVIE